MKPNNSKIDCNYKNKCHTIFAISLFISKFVAKFNNRQVVVSYNTYKEKHSDVWKNCDTAIKLKNNNALYRK